MKFKNLVLFGSAASLLLASLSCMAQQSDAPRPTYGDKNIAPAPNSVNNPDWTEEQIPPPPAFSVDRLVPLNMPPYVSVRVGVDPETIVVGNDGVVRYVIVIRNATGNTYAVYEGIRCASDEVKTYARKSNAGDWSFAKTPVWIGVTENMPSQHAKAFARQGACNDGMALTRNEIMAALKVKNVPVRNIQAE